MPSKKQEMQYLIRSYREATGNHSVDMHEVAKFAVGKGWPVTAVPDCRADALILCNLAAAPKGIPCFADRFQSSLCLAKPAASDSRSHDTGGHSGEIAALQRAKRAWNRLGVHSMPVA